MAEISLVRQRVIHHAYAFTVIYARTRHRGKMAFESRTNVFEICSLLFGQRCNETSGDRKVRGET